MQTRQEVVHTLSEQLRRFEGSRRNTDWGRISSGCAGLDRLLPGSGLMRGTLVEWLGVGPGSGASTLALLAAREACRRSETTIEGGPVVFVDRRRRFYPPAACSWGIDPAMMIVVRPANDADEGWVLDQVLRSSRVAAVLAWPERLDARVFRRLQLAAETSGGLGLFVRGEKAREEPSWADVRWLVRPRPIAVPQADSTFHGRRLQVELVRARGGPARGAVELEIDPQTGTVRETRSTSRVAESVRSTRHPRSARA